MKTLTRCSLAFLFTFFLTFLCVNPVSAQDTSFANEYGCNSLYTNDNPDILADYMVELIGHQPVKTTLTSYIEEIPCPDIDTGRIIFNVCGLTGDEHAVCKAWIAEFPKFYSEQFYYDYYSSTLIASQRSRLISTPDTIETNEETEAEKSEGGFSFNIIHVLVSLLILSGLGYIGYNRAMRKSTPSTVTRED